MKICNRIDFLIEEAKKECFNYIKRADFESLVKQLSNNNINDGKTYIIIDYEDCIIKNKDKINFYGTNQFCNAVKKSKK